MTKATRIILNATASYGRSLLALGLGLFSSRWVLAALGKEDLGLFGLVGSTIFIVGMLNGILSSAISRYYAFALGEAESLPEDEGRENVVKWFNTAVCIHTIVPIVLVAIGYPVGLYAFNHWLVIPAERLSSCAWVFRISLGAAFVGMVSVPYTAMYTAKQLIAEVSLLNMLQTIVIFVGAYCLMSWPGDRLIAYAGYMAVVPISISVYLVIRARLKFRECTIRLRYFLMFDRLRRLFSFALGELFGWVGYATQLHGMAFLINQRFGLGVNAAYTISNQVSLHTKSLSEAMLGAMVPAVTTAEGTGDHAAALRLSFRGIKFGVLAIAIFAIPLFLEIESVLDLWLVNPPEGAPVFCRCMLVAIICFKLGWGQHMAILAKGRIVLFQLIAGIVDASGIAIALLFLLFGWGLTGVALTFVVTNIGTTMVRVLFARALCGMPIAYWLFKVVTPILICLGVSFAGGSLVRGWLEPSVMRILLVSAASAIGVVACGYLIVCDGEERLYLKAMVNRIGHKILGGKGFGCG